MELNERSGDYFYFILAYDDLLNNRFNDGAFGLMFQVTPFG